MAQLHFSETKHETTDVHVTGDIPRAECSCRIAGVDVDGKRLHDANCTSCHDASVYTRPNRSIRSLDALQQQLVSCGHVVKKQFSPTETQNLVKYLNDRFYHFE